MRTVFLALAEWHGEEWHNATTHRCMTAALLDSKESLSFHAGRLSSDRIAQSRDLFA
jgi:hypothetical protein